MSSSLDSLQQINRQSFTQNRTRLEEYKDPDQARGIKKAAEALRPFFDDRDTASTLYYAGPMRVEHFDKESGILTARFESREDHQKIHRIVSERMAAYANYAGAKRMAEKAGVMKSIPVRTWLEKALESTAEQLQDEKNGAIAFNYRSQAFDVSTSRQKEEKVYEECIRQLKGAFHPPIQDPETFFNHFAKACSLKPNHFEPFYFALIYSSFFAESYLEIFEEVLTDAYAVSPIQTFNCLMVYLPLMEQRDPESNGGRVENILKAFQRCFPSEIAIAMSIRDFTARTQQTIVENSEQQVADFKDQFAQHTENALNFIKIRDLKSAREEFLSAAKFHISDKRSYMYMALIELQRGDRLSALKQTTYLERTIRLNDKAYYRRAIDSFWDYFLNEKKGTLEREAPPESAVLKTLIKLFSSRSVELDALKKFDSAIKVYLEDSNADPLWAQLAIDLVFEQCKELPDRVAVFTHLYGQVPAFLYFKLASAGEDLTEFEEFFSQSPEGNLNISISVLTQSSLFSTEPLCIDSNSFEISQKTETQYLKSLLRETYAQFGSLFLRWAGSLDEWEENLLTDLSDECGSMSSFFISALLDRYDAEGTEAQKTKLIEWACKHFKLYPESQKEDLTRLVLRWQLERPIPCMGGDSLTEAARKWLQLVSFKFSPAPTPGPKEEELFELESNRPLGIAFRVWSLIHDQAFDKAVDQLDHFFQDSENLLSEEIDPAALRALCLARTLLSQQDLIRPRIFTSLSEREIELAGAALSMIAREGVIMPYIIPKKPLSKKESQQLYRLYLGQKRGESDAAYKKRLEESRIPDLSNLRQSKRFKEFNEKETPDAGPSWVFPFLGVHAIQEGRKIVQDTIERQKLRMEKNQQIGEEKPSYSEDPALIDWVTNNKNLVADYLKNPQRVREEIDRRFPRLAKKEELIEELREKAKHEEALRVLKAKTAPPEKTPGKRFWQLIRQTAQIVETATTSQRNEETFDLYVMNKEEARFVMQLIYERGLDSWGDREMKIYAEAFHGPETHIWGKGPRHPHFNAGAYVPGKERPINIHIFY